MIEQNPQDDPLEAELASFRPQSISPKLRQRINAELTRGPIRWVSVLAGLAAAACVALGFMIWRNNPTLESSPPMPAPPAVAATDPPNVMDYQRAFAQSSDAFEVMLARPAGRAPSRPEPRAQTIRAFSLAQSNGDSL
jgi:hypothetical protein